ncbi:uncharacterized protein LOC126550992 [Aphis gossypii]|uniref:uncharacterized protein LOC126550992 n=1 Tax=Aphis gossypii TaxID=80765 RepID=UPI002158B276|nr:uncharacterized protein LOC126550992 [Aphis gossypii]
MMINTFKFSKGLIISITYIVIILTFVKCAGSGTSGSDTEDNKKQPVPDFEPGGVDDKNYFQYHFRSTYPGRLKLSPKHYFASKYGKFSKLLKFNSRSTFIIKFVQLFDFFLLPDLKYINMDPLNVRNEYEYYKERIYIDKKYEDRLKNLRDIKNEIEIEDNAFGKLFECY